MKKEEVKKLIKHFNNELTKYDFYDDNAVLQSQLERTELVLMECGETLQDVIEGMTSQTPSLYIHNVLHIPVFKNNTAVTKRCMDSSGIANYFNMPLIYPNIPSDIFLDAECVYDGWLPSYVEQVTLGVVIRAFQDAVAKLAKEME